MGDTNVTPIPLSSTEDLYTVTARRPTDATTVAAMPSFEPRLAMASFQTRLDALSARIEELAKRIAD